MIGLAQGLTDTVLSSRINPGCTDITSNWLSPPWQRLELGQFKLSLALEDFGLDRHSGDVKTGNRWQSTMFRIQDDI